jgi:hypothetical protein
MYEIGQSAAKLPTIDYIFEEEGSTTLRHTTQVEDKV